MDLDFGASHRRRSFWGEYRAQIHDPVGDQRNGEAALRQGGGGNHGQVSSDGVDNDDVVLCLCLVCVVSGCLAVCFCALNKLKFVT